VNKAVQAQLSFGSLVVEDIHYVTVPAQVSEQSAEEFILQISAWVNLPVKKHIFNFAATTRVVSGFANALRVFSAKIMGNGVNMVSLNMSEALFQQFKNSGAADFLYRTGADKRPAEERQLGEIEKRRLLFKYLAEGTFQAVKVALGSTVSCDANYNVKPDSVPLDQFDLVSVLRIKSDFLKAEFRLCATLAVIERLTRAMLGPDIPIDQELIEGTPVEMLNMIYGYAKSHLNEAESVGLPMSIPVLVRKSDFKTLQRSPASQVTIMPMVTPMGPFYIEVDFGAVK
jgi:hypothetical protein